MILELPIVIIKMSRALKQFGKRIVKIRLQLNMTQEDLAFKAKISLSHLRQIEHGDTNPSFLILERLANALKVSLSELLKGV